MSSPFLLQLLGRVRRTTRHLPPAGLDADGRRRRGGEPRGIDDRLANVHRIKLKLAAAPPEGANYVILGSDTRAVVDPGDSAAFGDAATVQGQRSDTLMVAHIEPQAQKTLVVSFHRDLVVDIPGHGKNKINAAYDLGGGGADGAKLVIQTLEANFPGLKINHYVQVDFRSFRSVVDAIGSVGVYFPLNTHDYDTSQQGDTSFEVKAGCAKLNGDAALQYVRSRHLQEQDPNTLQWKSIDIIPDIAGSVASRPSSASWRASRSTGASAIRSRRSTSPTGCRATWGSTVSSAATS